MSYENFLHLVSKPARYISAEKNAIRKDLGKVDVSMLLCFPEVYEIGMSHLGLKILYHVLNQKDFVAAERCFAPWPDMEEQLRKNNQSLLSLESQRPLSEFDFLGFSLQSELTFSNMLNILDLSYIPLLAEERTEEHPIVLAGGPVTSNPEPCAAFVDAFLIGDGEEATQELADYYRLARKKGLSRERILVGIANIPGFYVPRFYREIHDENGKYLGVERITDEVPKKVVRRYVAELKPEYYPEKPVIPQTAAVQDRHVVEVVRGCTQGCRFCQAGYIYRPIREMSTENIVKMTQKGIEETGYEEVGLVSLSTADYSDVSNMVREVSKYTTPRNVAISLPSLRADSFSVDLADSVKQVKQTGFTFAPEAGSVRLRRVINKNITNDELLLAVRNAFEKGWSVIKLYFMVGLPTETWEDLDETVDLIKKVEKIAKEVGGRKKVNVSFGPFVAKAHTPFQWDSFMGCDEIRARQQYVRKAVSSKIVQFKWQDPELSHFESVVSKGGREVAKGLLQMYYDGSRFEGWQETFDYERTMESFRKAGLNIEEICSEKSVDDALPWDHIDSSIKKKFLIFERKKAFREEKQTTTDCRFGDCHYCGIPTPKVDIRLQHSRPSEEEYLKRRAEWTVIERAIKPYELDRGNSLRYRLHYTKEGNSRFMAHSDMIRILQMGLGQAKFPMVYSKGFNPHPEMQFGPVLPLGIESGAEIFDLWAHEALNSEMIATLNNYLPDGIRVSDWYQVELSEPSLSVLFPYAVYSVLGEGTIQRFASGIERLEKTDSMVVENRGKQIDLKIGVRTAEIVDRKLMLELNVVAKAGNNANPVLVLENLFGFSREELGALYVRKELSVQES